MTTINVREPREQDKEALAIIAKALGSRRGQERETLLLIATFAICMIHGTYGKEFCRDFLRGAVEELDLPDGLKIQLQVQTGPTQ